MMSRPSCRLMAALSTAWLATLSTVHAADDDIAALTLQPLDSIKLGNAGSAEIGAHDPVTQRLFVVNFAASSVSILSTRNPAQLTLVATIDVSAFGSPNSVAVSQGIMAVAIENADKTHPGRVGFYRTNGELLTTVQVGALPDMLTFTPDGEYLLIANEGEPNGYGDGFTDPEGSVSIIRVPTGHGNVKKLKDSDVRTARFTQYDGQEAGLRAQGIRIYGPGATAAKDFEPEYIAVSADSRKAYVTLQENNAIAVIDVGSARVTGLLPLGYKDWNTPPYTVATFEWENDALPPIGLSGNEMLRLGGFSGLAFEGSTADGKLKFIANTDRGPNGEPNAAGERPFLLPGFSPRLVRFELDPASGRFTLTQQILLRNAAGIPLTGLPNTALAGNTNTPYNDEVPINLHGEVLQRDPLGGDFEGIAVDEDGTFWLPDEYRPALYHVGSTGRLIARYIPIGTHAAAGLAVPTPGTAGALGIEALPAVLGQRRQNRGMEAIAIQDGKIYVFVQSPIRNPASLSNGALNALRNIRIVEFDPTTLASRQFLYAMDNPDPEPGNPDDSRADKIGDAVAVPGGGFLVVERDDDAVDSDELSNITKKVYAFKISMATDISSFNGVYLVNGVNKSIDQMTAAELALVGVQPIVKTLHVDLAAAGYAGIEKIEGLALLDDGRLALVNDNDFGVAQIAIDTASGSFSRLPGYVPEPVTLSIISVTGLDASDRDNAINIRNWPVYGMYQPDAIAAYSARGRTYLVTANEGDARSDWPGLNEEVRVGNNAVTLDPAAFPNGAATMLKQNANLGRLNITNQLGDSDADGDYDALYTYGGRSFSIWANDGTQVFDSDADLERLTAATFPTRFNASNDNNNVDDRSDNKGPEPEGLDVGTINGRTYVFLGLERIGGIAAYDITSPTAPLFMDYVNTRDFADVTSPAIGDLGPEGVLFIPAHQSPTHRPLVVVANEVSGTVATFEIESCGRSHRWADKWSKYWRWYDRGNRCSR